MSNKETKARVANAFRAMKAIGISEDKVKPVLKTLLKLYDKNWELIEEENYRALADAIFERDESEAVEHSKKTANDEAAEPSNQIVNAQETENHVGEEAQVTEDPERPLKRLRRRYQDGQTSSLNTSSSGVAETSLVRPKEEPNELPETHSSKINGSQRILESPQLNAEGIRTRSQALASQSLDKNKGKQPISPKSTETSRNQQNTQLRTESRSQPHPMRLKFRAAVALSSQVPSQEKTPVPESSSHALSLKEPKVEPGLLLSPMRKSTAGHPLIVPKDEPVTGDTLPLDAPIMTVQPGNSNGDSASRNGMICGNGFPEPSTLQSSEREKSDGTVALNEPGNGSELALVSGDCSTTLQIASSPSGEVKISLNCNLARRRPDFHMPSLEAVVKAVDDKCLRSPQTLDLNLSVMNIMKEMCHCFLKLGTDSSNESPETLDVNSAVGSVNRSALNGSVGSPSDANLAMPETPLLLPPCNGVNDESQHNKMYDGDEIVTNKENKKNCNEETNDINLGFVKQPPVTPEIIRSRHDVADIAKGQEKVAITVSNDVNDEFPPSFYYIPQSAPYQNAYVNFSLARIGDNNSCSTCSGDCLSLSVPCACANETGGQFAYTPDGLVKEELLKECISMNRNPTKRSQFFCKECPLERSKREDIDEPCKGHLVRKFIKECWWKCGCNKQCGNRVVQRGITRNLQVFMTPGGKGWGLRTLEDLPKGAFVCEYVGEILTNSELFDRVSRSPEGEKHSYPVLLDADWRAEGVLKDEEALCLDATYYGNVSRFINHRCYDSTLVEIPVEVETPDHHYYHLAFFTTRKVKAMEELTWDYGIDFDDQEHPIKAFRCQCGSKFCRNIKRSRTRSRR